MLTNDSNIIDSERIIDVLNNHINNISTIVNGAPHILIRIPNSTDLKSVTICENGDIIISGDNLVANIAFPELSRRQVKKTTVYMNKKYGKVTETNLGGESNGKTKKRKK